MATNRYVCRNCNVVHEFDSRRKRIICPYCDRDISWNSLFSPIAVGDTYYNGYAYMETETLTIPEGVKFIEWKSDGTFSWWKIGSISFPSTLQSIPGSCFSHCRSLKKVVIPKNVTHIGVGAFAHCEDLEEVILSEGVEEIGMSAFYHCPNLKCVTLPSTLKKIGDYAFLNDFSRSGPLRLVVLPGNITEIGKEAFSWESIHLSVKAGSKTEQCVDKMKKKHGVRGWDTGLALSKEVWDGKLYFWSHSKQTRINIPDGVTSIASYAFADCPSVEQVSFPDSLKEIEPYAFYGCTHLTTLSFGKGLEKIGTKAFCEIKKTLIELPSSIKAVASDAFGSGCVLVVDGDMPFYASRRQALDILSQNIAAKKEEIAKAKDLKTTMEETLAAYVKDVPAEFENIPVLQAQIEKITRIRVERVKPAEDRKSAHSQLIRQCEEEINNLSQQYEQCSFLAIFQRRELSRQIASKQGERAQLLIELDELVEGIAAEQQRFRDEIRPIQKQQDALTESRRRWTEKKNDQVKSIQELEADIRKKQGELEALQAQYTRDEAILTTAHDRWQREKDALLQERKAQALRHEKKKILADLRVSMPAAVTIFEYTPRKAMVEESLLNTSFLQNLGIDHAVKHNQYVADHTAELNRVREINALLGLDSESDLTQYQPMAVSDEAKSLPERFTVISAFFAKTQEWRLLKQALKPYADSKRPKTNPLDSFFAGADYVRLSIQDTQLLLFPYCIVKCESKKPMWVYSYDQAVLTISHTEQTNEFRVLPPHAELIGERYTYLNQDGSVDRRHKINPILKTVRYSTATISCAKETVKLLFDSLAEATAFEEAFTAYQQFLTDSTYRNIYRTVIRSEDIAAFESAVAKHKQDELRRIEEEKKRVEAARIAAEEAEKQREAERIAAEKAAEERRLAIIRRQKEANEERKRQEAERKRAHSLFEDVVEESDVSVQSEQSAAALVEITGNRLISNNVFKVNYRPLRPISDNGAVCYFVATDGSLISNKRKLPNGEVGAEATVGFVLTSGVDYTQMKSCTLRVEVDGTIVDTIDFKMNVSFYSDF